MSLWSVGSGRRTSYLRRVPRVAREPWGDLLECL